MTVSISQVIKNSLVANDMKFKANDNISEVVDSDALDALQVELAAAVQNVLDVLVIDTSNDHNTRDTAKRVAKMLLRETLKGRYEPAPNLTEFPNHLQLDELYVTGPITVRSMCSHHMQPIMGQAFVGVLPGENVIGLSKFNRLIEWFASRPQIQEELTVQIANYLEEKLKPKALGVVIRAQHYCMKCRGVKESSGTMTTSVVRGALRHQPTLKHEFFALIAMNEKQG